VIPAVSIVGKSNSGKTTLIEKLIHELRNRSYRVATIKHNRHGFDIDHEGKDSWRHKKAGAQMTVIASPIQVAIIEDTERDYEISELIENYIHDVDIVLIEGFKNNAYPKIEVFRSVVRHELLYTPHNNYIAIASDQPFDIGIPSFDINNVTGIADLIEDSILNTK
jgi:molybdopterin-guanine dinucleotide biosynthesis protein MobB